MQLNANEVALSESGNPLETFLESAVAAYDTQTVNNNLTVPLMIVAALFFLSKA